MAIKYTNNATTTLSASLTAGATSLTVDSNGNFPSVTLASGDYFYATLIEGATTEIIKVTDSSTTTWTIERAQDGSVASSFSDGISVDLRNTRATIQDTFQDSDLNWSTSGTLSASNTDAHIASTSNPHSVTAAQVGLDNVDNTADSDKPVSTAQSAAIDAAVLAHASQTDNPHSVTKSQVGLGNVDNTSDLDKPVSTAQSAALDQKIDESLLTSTGDIIYRDDSGPNRLPLGTTSHVLTSSPSGPIWAAAPGAGGGEANTNSNLPGDEGIATAKVGVDTPLKSLTAGTNITLSSDANTITINSTGGGGSAPDDTPYDSVSWDANTDAATKNALRDKFVTNDAAIALNTAKVSADGSVTSHSDVTDAGSGAIITGAERTKLDGIEAGAQVNRTLDAVPTNGNTANSVSSDGVFDALALKADASTVITAGVGLTGGGDLSAGRTIDLDINSLSPATGADQLADLIAVYNQNDSGTRSITLGELQSLIDTGGGGGEVNTATSIGVGGVSIVEPKVGVDLQFKSVNAGSAKISVSEDAVNKNIDIDLGTVSAADLSDVTDAGSGAIITVAERSNLHTHSNKAVLDATTASFLIADETKLDGIESGAQVNTVDSVHGRTGAVVAATNDYTWAQINKAVSNIADIATRSHTSLTDIGTNSHAQIDSHISDSSVHFTVGSIDHGSISGLGDDDHSQYALLTGRAGGQILYGGNAANDNLTLEATSNATKGEVIINNSELHVKADVPRLVLDSNILDNASRPSISIRNNSVFTFQGDDHADQQFNFYAGFSSNRTNDARFKVVGKGSGFNQYIEFTHDGTDGIVTTGAGNLDLSSNGGQIDITDPNLVQGTFMKSDSVNNRFNLGKGTTGAAFTFSIDTLGSSSDGLFLLAGQSTAANVCNLGPTIAGSGSVLQCWRMVPNFNLPIEGVNRSLYNYNTNMVINSSGDTVSSAFAMFSKLTINAANVGQISNGYGLNISGMTNSSSATVVNWHGIAVNDNVAPNVNNNYACSLQMSAGTNKYNIHAVGTAKNLFNGNVALPNLPTGAGSPPAGLDAGTIWGDTSAGSATNPVLRVTTVAT